MITLDEPEVIDLPEPGVIGLPELKVITLPELRQERRVVFAPEAAEDLNELYDWISRQASPIVAMGYLERVEAFCRRLSVGSERGHLRPNVRPGLRILGFERRLTIAFVVQEETVAVLRVFTAGRNWEKSF